MTSGGHVYLEHQGQLIELPAGQIVLGRGPSCGIRFNDPLVSREHALLRVESDRIYAQDLGSCNGTLLNGSPLTESQELGHDDRLQLGARVLRVTLLKDQEGEGLTPTPGWPAASRVRPKARPVTQGELPDINVVTHTCPQCRTGVGIDLNACPHCGYVWPAGGVTSVTQRISLVGLHERRSNGRMPVNTPLIYSGEDLTFEATARDLSRGGVFVKSDLLEPVGAFCRVTLLPDAHPAVVIQGTVCRIVAATEQEDRGPSGMGIRFDVVSDAARAWLDGTLGSVAS